MPELGRVPPHDIEAEQAILGCMLTDKDSVIAAMEKLKVDDFYREDNRQIYEAMMTLSGRAEPIDIITVKAELVSNGNFEQVGGLEYLVTLPEKTPTTTNIDKYIKIVEEKATLRNLIRTANDIIANSYDQTEDVEQIINDAEKKIYDINQGKSATGYIPLKNVLISSFSELERLYNQKGKISGLATGFIDLDNKTSGLHNSNLIIIAARPAMGKSAFAINIATHVALNNNVPVLVFSLEMPKEQVANRILCSEALVDSNKVQTGKIDDNEWIKFANASARISEAQIFIDDTPEITMNDIRTRCRKLKSEKGLGLVVIDYLQLIKAKERKNGSREQEISDISRTLKILAKELDVPVIALSQLARSAEKRDDKRPMLSDLRESGAIEQDADIVMFLYRDDYYNKETEKRNIAEVIIAKHRGGATGTVELAWLGNYTKFANREKYRNENE